MQLCHEKFRAPGKVKISSVRREKRDATNSKSRRKQRQPVRIPRRKAGWIASPVACSSRVRLSAGCPNYQQGFEKAAHKSSLDRYVCRGSNEDRIPLDLPRRNPGRRGRLLGAEWRKIGRNSAGWRRRSAGS